MCSKNISCVSDWWVIPYTGTTPQGGIPLRSWGWGSKFLREICTKYHCGNDPLCQSSYIPLITITLYPLPQNTQKTPNYWGNYVLCPYWLNNQSGQKTSLVYYYTTSTPLRDLFYRVLLSIIQNYTPINSA